MAVWQVYIACRSDQAASKVGKRWETWPISFPNFPLPLYLVGRGKNGKEDKKKVRSLILLPKSCPPFLFFFGGRGRLNVCHLSLAPKSILRTHLLNLLPVRRPILLFFPLLSSRGSPQLDLVVEAGGRQVGQVRVRLKDVDLGKNRGKIRLRSKCRSRFDIPSENELGIRQKL